MRFDSTTRRAPGQPGGGDTSRVDSAIGDLLRELAINFDRRDHRTSLPIYRDLKRLGLSIVPLSKSGGDR